MKKFIPLLFLLVLGFSFQSFSQDEIPAYIKEKITYPVLDFHPYVGVMPVEEPALPYNPELDYKVVLDLYGGIKDSTAIHPSILEVARTYNLGIANGVPQEKLHLAAVVHGGLVNAILSDIEYEKKFSIKNPNLLAIEELEKVGVQFYVCGQSMAFLQIGKEKLTPLVHPAISAKYSFVTLGQMGYVYLNVSE
jgi:intracellular sulfur oxidation DsrE/DsrF family protein